MKARALSPSEAAVVLGCSREHICALAEKGQIAHARLGKRWLICPIAVGRLAFPSSALSDAEMARFVIAQVEVAA